MSSWLSLTGLHDCRGPFAGPVPPAPVVAKTTAFAGVTVPIRRNAGPVMASGILGVTPLTGVVTPFLSYGGSAMVANFCALGMSSIQCLGLPTSS